MDDIFNLTDKIKTQMLDGTFKPRKTNHKVNLQELKKDVEYNLSEKRLYELETKYGDVIFAGAPKSRNQNRWRFISDFHLGIPMSSALHGKLIKKINKKYNNKYMDSGLFHYPPGGYCGWHTNSDCLGERIYLVWAEEDNKSFFRYRDLDTGEIITRWEKKGWQVQRFEPPTWHCVGSYTNRISVGFREQKDIVYDTNSPIILDTNTRKFIKTEKLNGRHTFTNGNRYGEWRINPIKPNKKIKKYYKFHNILDKSVKNSKFNLFLELCDLKYLLTDENLKTLKLEDICWKGKNLVMADRGENCICCQGQRYKLCDIKYPPIVVENMSNPMNLKYRLLDGKHRSEKMLAQGITESKFYLLQREDVEKHLLGD
jgi:hypothetical protein